MPLTLPLPLTRTLADLRWTGRPASLQGDILAFPCFHGEVSARGFWIWFIVACLAAIPSARADGPPVNIDGTIDGEHVVLHLSQAEQDEVGRWRFLTVSPAHWKALRKRMRRVPEVLQIVTPFYDDCTCDIPVYGIWNRPFEVAVPIEARAEGPSPDEFERKRIARKEETAGRAAAVKRAPDP